MPVLDCLHTTVRNMSGESRFYGFLPPHGQELSDGEELTVFGDLTDRVAHPYDGRRERAYQTAIDAGLVIVKTPLVHLYDPVAAETKGLALEDGSLGIVDPCWGAYSSSGAVEPTSSSSSSSSV